jgi:hypothetical protein
MMGVTVIFLQKVWHCFRSLKNPAAYIRKEVLFYLLSLIWWTGDDKTENPAVFQRFCQKYFLC